MHNTHQRRGLSIEAQVRAALLQHCGVQDGDCILVGVSGGIDSIVLLHILHALRFPLSVLHINHRLRGDESDGDEAFVSEICDSLSIPITCERLPINKKSNLQAQARTLRMNALKSKAERLGMEHIALGHHADDQLETVLLRLIRGAGTKGLSGMRYRNGKIIRPMLSISREDISSYAEQEGLNWREDSSNATLKYARNRVRHSIVPLLKALNPSILETISRNSLRMQDTWEFLNRTSEGIRNEGRVEGTQTLFTREILRSLNSSEMITLVLQPWGIYPELADNILEMLRGGGIGKFSTSTHDLMLDGVQLSIAPISADYEVSVQIDHGASSTSLMGMELRFSQCSPLKEMEQGQAGMDLSKVRWPLTWRLWKPGDRFQPTGMKGSKTLGDFFTDIKLPWADRIRQTVLVDSEREILWVVGLRLSETVRIGNDTKHFLLIVKR